MFAVNRQKGRPVDLARAALIASSTAWTYFCRAAEHVAARDLARLVPALVPRELWNALLAWRGREVLGGPLTELRSVLQRELRVRVRMHELRLARLAVVRIEPARGQPERGK